MSTRANHQARICQMLSYLRRGFERGGGWWGCSGTQLEQAGRRFIMLDVPLASRVTIAYLELESFLEARKIRVCTTLNRPLGLALAS